MQILDRNLTAAYACKVCEASHFEIQRMPYLKKERNTYPNIAFGSSLVRQELL